VSIHIHEASLPYLARFLRALDRMIDKAAAFAEAKQGKSAVSVEASLINARLAPDMFAFARQVQIATDMAKGCAARLAGVEVPKYDDTETTFAELKARIARTVAFIESFKADQLDGAEARTIQLKTGGREVTFPGRDYLFGFVYPNVFFHLTTAYNLLRHNGVELGKMDLLG
jgi:hypothetical protein